MADVGASSVPVFVDLDGDGDFDMLVGDAVGDISYLENTGTAISPAFASETDPFGVGASGTYYIYPTVADIDSDGDLDLFAGDQNGDIEFFRNNGEAFMSFFDFPVTNPFGLIDIGGGAVPSFTDLDGDGDLDAIIGESNTNIN